MAPFMSGKHFDWLFPHTKSRNCKEQLKIEHFFMQKMICVNATRIMQITINIYNYMERVRLKVRLNIEC